MKKTQTARLDPYNVLPNRDIAVESRTTADDRLENMASALSTDSTLGFNLFRTLIDNMSDFIYVKDSECRYVNCNQVIPPMNGFSSALELMGKTDYDLYPMELANRYYADEQKILKTGEPIVNQEEPYIDAKGNIKWVSVSKITIPDREGKYIGIVGINRDITEHKLSMEKINEQATLLDETPDAIIVRNMDDHILFWNKSAERLYGYSANETLNKKSYELLYSEDQTKLAAIEQSVISNGEWSGEVIQKTKENKQITVHSRQTLVQDKLGFPKSILVLNTDITEKKHHDYQMLRAQRMEGIGTLASGIAHDLNNLLAPIILATDLLLTNPSQEKSIDFLKTIKKSAKRAGTVVNQVLTFSRGVENGESILFHPKHIAKEIIQITK
jgi:PAS domain S-box-containing protein